MLISDTHTHRTNCSTWTTVIVLETAFPRHLRDFLYSAFEVTSVLRT